MTRTETHLFIVLYLAGASALWDPQPHSEAAAG